MLIITGCGRSGTSVLARHCHNMGYMTGGRWHDSVNAGMEEPEVYNLNESIRDGNEPSHTSKFIQMFNRQVVKDPRFTHEGVMKRWASVRGDLKVIMLIRDAKNVVKSRSSNLEFFREPISEHVIHRRIYNTYLTLSRFSVPTLTLEFPSYLDDYDRIYKALTDFGGLKFDRTRGEASWYDLVDEKKVHHK